LLREFLETAKRAPDLGRVEIDADDPDRQSLLLWYPTSPQVARGTYRKCNH